MRVTSAQGSGEDLHCRPTGWICESTCHRYDDNDDEINHSPYTFTEVLWQQGKKVNFLENHLDIKTWDLLHIRRTLYCRAIPLSPNIRMCSPFYRTLSEPGETQTVTSGNIILSTCEAWQLHVFLSRPYMQCGCSA